MILSAALKKVKKKHKMIKNYLSFFIKINFGLFLKDRPGSYSDYETNFNRAK